MRVWDSYPTRKSSGLAHLCLYDEGQLQFPMQGAVPALLSVITSEEAELALMSSGLALPTTSVGEREGGEGITPTPTTPHSRQVARPALPYPCPQGCFAHDPQPGLAVLCFPGDVQGQAPASSEAHEGQGHITCSRDPRASSPDCRRW